MMSYSQPTSRGMGAILKIVKSDTERGDIVEREVLRSVDEIVPPRIGRHWNEMILGTIGAGIDFDGKHQQELDDND